MMPMSDTDADDQSLAECSTVECEQRSDSPPTMPDFHKRAMPVSGSRDLVKRDALVGRDDEGNLVYQLQEEDDEGKTVGDFEEDGEDEEEESSDAEDEVEQLESRALSTSFARGLVRRASDAVSSLVRRKSKSNKKTRKSGRGRANKSRPKSGKKGSKSSKKQSSKGRKSKSNKASSALALGEGLIMKGATLL